MATINDVEKLLARAIRCGYNLKLVSEPAIGKTMEIHRLAAKWLAEGKIDFFSVLNGPSVSPIDLSATMPDMVQGILKRFHDGSLPNHYKTPNLKGFIYMGEGEQMGLEAQRPWQKICNREDFGDHLHPIRLPDGVIICTDGNRMSDRSGGQVQGRALGSRFDTIQLMYDSEIALTYATTNFHPKIGAFLQRNVGLINNYAEVYKADRVENDPMKIEGKHGTWASLRSWNRLSDKLHDVDTHNDPMLLEEYQCVGSGVAATFAGYLRLLDKLPVLEEIVKKPLDAHVPTRMDEQWAITYMLALTAKAKVFRSMAKYMHRLPREFQMAFLLTMNDRFANLQAKAPPGTVVTEGQAIRQTPEFLSWTAEPGMGDMLIGTLAA